ncbi:MAG: HEPN domain-containing protein [Actinomycetota bacterium]
MTPGQAEQARLELEHALEALEESRVLMMSGTMRGSISRLYYAVFHAARAALLVRGCYSKTHSGQITLFNDTFGEAVILGRLFELRGKADYALEGFSISREVVHLRITEATELIERCRTIVDEATGAGADEPDPPPDL